MPGRGAVTTKDRQTLVDLEIDVAPSRGPDLVNFLARTRSKGGYRALRRRMTSPLPSANAIRDVHRTLRFVQTHRMLFDTIPGEADLSALVSYLDAPFDTVQSTAGLRGRIEGWWTAKRYREMYGVAKRGGEVISSFLLCMKTLSSIPDASLLEAISNEIRAIIESPPIESLLIESAGKTARHILHCDHTARRVVRTYFERLLQLVFEVDALVSMWDVTAEKGYVLPDIDEDCNEIVVEGLVHPFVRNPVANSFRLDSGTLLFITGPNTAGKSTFLKACGAAILLAQTGMGVPARRFRTPVFDVILTVFPSRDNLQAGLSHFQVEARRMASVASLAAKGRRCLIILDELFCGTNAVDCYAANVEVLGALASANHCMAIVSSHLDTLAQDLGQLDCVEFACFVSQTGAEEPSFDYRIRAGVATQHLGSHVLQSEGLYQALSALRLRGQPASKTKGSVT